MIEVTPVQDAMIAFLKSKTAITAIVGQEIRESQYQSTLFTYPMLRVNIQNASSSGESICDDKWARVTCMIGVYTEEDSGRSARLLGDEVVKAVRRKSLSVPNVLRTGLMRTGNVNGAIRLSEHAWRVDVLVGFNAYMLGL